MSLARSILGLLCIGVLTTACGADRVTEEDRLTDAIAASESLSREIAYTDASREVTYDVAVMVEDDFRYDARLSIDAVEAYREVVDDDALTVRVLDPRGLAVLTETATSDEVAGAVDVAGEATPDAVADAAAQPPVVEDGDATAKVEALLRSGVWVRDELGAPELFTGTAEGSLGDDPIADALTVPDYVRSAIGQSAGVVRFDESAIEYRPDEDPFPAPDEDAGEIRYDLNRPPLPRPQDADASGLRQPPGIEHFRKLSVYVRDGRVVKVFELVEVLTLLDELSDRFDIEVDGDAAAEVQAELAIEAVNALRREIGEEPIRLRAMSYEITDRDQELSAEVPDDVAVTSLLLLQDRGSQAGSVAALLADGTAEPGTAPEPPIVAPPASSG